MQVTNPKASTGDPHVVPPPASMTVADRKIILYNADGQALVRKVGF